LGTQKSTSPPSSKRKNLGHSWGGIFEVANFLHLANFFFSKNQLNISFIQKNRLKATKKIFKITMFSHIVQQIAML
jgi:hypothetical protein